MRRGGPRADVVRRLRSLSTRAGHTGGGRRGSAGWGWGIGVAGAAAGLAALASSAISEDASEAARRFFGDVGRRIARVRVTSPAADIYRPFDPLLADEAVEGVSPPLKMLAALEDAGAHRTVAAVYLMSGHPALAEAALRRAPDDVDVAADRAAIAIERGRVEAAIRRLDAVLRRSPDHPQALWNRGLALEALGLSLGAAKAFEAVAALEEPGWSAAARTAAARLRDAVEGWRSAWYAARDAGAAMVAGGAPVPVDVARDFPGLTRLYLYDALRSAESPERVDALRPVAAALDAHYGGEVLSERVAWTRRRDFGRRAPLARRYRKLAVEGWLPEPQLEALLAGARRADAPDILIGALYLGRVETAHVDAYEALARRLDDPWFDTLAKVVRATAARAKGRLDLSLSTLLEAREGSSIAYRTSHAELELLRDVVELSSLSLGQRILESLAARTVATREWSQHLEMLQQRGSVHLQEDDHAPLAEAFLTEAALREPERCDVHRFVRDRLTLSHLFENRVDEAARVASTWRRCRQDLTPSEALAWIGIARRRSLPVDDAFFDAQVRTLPERVTGPGARLFAESVQARWALERGAPEGLSRALRVIEEADRRPAWDQPSIRARSQAYYGLVAHAAERGRYREALAHLSARLSIEPPTTCGVGLYIESELYLVVTVDRAGDLRATYRDDYHESLARADPRALIPERRKRDLVGCDEVRVVTHPPLLGRAAILPGDMAWFYAVAGGGPAEGPAEDRPLIVADVVLPRELGLPPLPPYRSLGRPPPGARVLAGHQATRDRVLAAMTTATEIQLYTHGFYDLGRADAAMLLMTPDAAGRYALTAADVAEVRLRGAPLVLLTACHSGRTARVRDHSPSLPLAFLRAGARAVVAAETPLPAAGGRKFFARVREAARRGLSAAQATREARASMPPGLDWVEGVLVYGR